MDPVYTSYRGNQSFSSSLLDEIYRSIDDEESTFYRENTRRKQSKFGGKNHDDERRACLIQKWMENKVCEKPVVGRRSTADLERSSMRSERDSTCFNSSSSSCDSSSNGGFYSSECDSKPKPIRTSVFYQHEDSQQKVKHESKFAKTKLKALKIYTDLKKVKQPISPGGRLVTFLNSILTTGNTKKHKTSSSVTTAATATATVAGGYSEAARSQLDRKSKSANASTCSSASSFSRSCLSNTPSSRGKLSNGMTRSVRFYPVSVIVDEDCQPCGHKSLHESAKLDKKSIQKELKHKSSENNRHIQEAARNLLKSYQKKVECKSDSIRNSVEMKDDEDEDQSDDGKSDSSSDLFELDNFSSIGMSKYQEGLPVYETTHIDTNRAIANGCFMQAS